ncbi:S8 family serine peptidase [Bdellovibrio sp. KM01]|uniref:S8 family serine peptidase n=1 Tax=Bdellovibrio sp. KM01 TaxID=2748865 RepID=UPI0015EAFA54|nr:S8 family serine peptidase [Bdellovibrio sp. KM01]QLY23845.1 S8 family serine peptidase [Bdellovibrio sp. KM01]
MTQVKTKSRVMMLSLAVILALPSCKTGPSQDPRDTFWNGRFPRQLEWMRSQVRELSQKERDAIVIRQEKDARRTDLLRVGVIDSGVDIAHKDLQAQIDYRIVDGRVAGAGIDVMGGGPSGTHVMVDPTLFSFGAREIKNGLIVEPVESPLQLIKQSNDIFVEHFYALLQNDPELKESLFAQLPKESLSLRGALEVTKLVKIEDHISTYGKEKPYSLEELKTNKAFDFYTGPDSYVPKMIKYASRMEHGKRFYEAMKEALEVTDQKTGLNKNIANLVTYLKIQQAQAALPVDRGDAIRTLDPAFNMVLWGADAFDPLTQLERKIKASDRWNDKTPVEVVESIISENKPRYEQLLKDLSLKKDEREAVRNAIKNIEKLRPLAQTLQNIQKDPEAYKKMKSDLRRYVIRTQHPYLAPDSNSNSHATHVSGVIAHQNEDIRIVPLRVTTGPIGLSPARQKMITDQYISEFHNWIQLPIVAELMNVISKEYSGMKMTPKRAESILRDYLQTTKGTLDAVFINDVVKAVEAAGAEQLKLANVSLGTTFKKDHNLDKKHESMVNDLFSEFVRYKIGQTMNEKAPGTLFVVATGNDGGWLDGVTKAGFPVGITSTRFLEISQRKGFKDTPNNAVKNILAVGSVNVNGTLTAFTNILIDPKVPQIFSTGEEIYSSVPAKSSEATLNMVSGQFKGVAEAQSLVGKTFENLEIMEKIKAQANAFETTSMIDSLQQSIALKIHLDAPLGRQNMSGTSMATPTVTGILANYLVKKMEKERISSKDAYLHPSMMPEQVVKDVMAMAKVSPHSQVITIKMLTEGIKKWGTAKEATIQASKAKEIFHPKPTGTGSVVRCEVVFR